MRRSAILGLLLLMAAALGAQPRHAPSLPDSARSLVRVELRLTTDARFASVRVLGENFAAARGQRLVGPDNLRTAVLENLLPLSNNVEGSTATGSWRLVLAQAEPGTTVSWFLNVQAGHRATIEVFNLNEESQPRLVDRFEGTVGTTFTTSADQLRVGGPLPHPPAHGAKLVLAYYYPWYERVTWADPQMIDQPLHAYSDDDAADVRRNLAEAHRAGVDVVIANWQRETGRDGWNYRRLQVVLQQAAQAGVRVCLQSQPFVDEAALPSPPDVDTITRWLDEVDNWFGTHPSYLRVDGRPVVFAYGWPYVSEATWRAAIDRLRASGQNPFIIADTTDSSAQTLADAISSYGDNIFAPDIQRHTRRVALEGRTFHLLGAAFGPPRLSIVTVSPGFDERKLRDRPERRFADRQDGAFYARQWAAALDSRPDWAVVTTWNEWWENSEIEPGQRYGDYYTTHTKAWADSFKSSRRR